MLKIKINIDTIQFNLLSANAQQALYGMLDKEKHNLLC